MSKYLRSNDVKVPLEVLVSAQAIGMRKGDSLSQTSNTEMLTVFDYGVIAFHFIFTVSLGLVFKRFASNTSDYFRGGGKMPWWLAGASAFMFSFSAWTFTGAASKAYTDGFIVYFIYLGNALGYALGFLVFAGLFRRMRVVTAIEAVRQRFGKANEQVLTWTQIPIGMLYAAIWLNGLAVFLSAVLQFDLHTTIVVTGVVVVAVSFVAGSWGVTASDFVQTLILLPISVVACCYSLSVVEPSRIVLEFPADTIWGNDINYPAIAGAWCIIIVLKNGVLSNNIQFATRFLSSKSEAHARKAALLAMVLFLLGPIVWFVPPMAAAISHPDLATIFPELSRPSEAAYLAIPLEHFPKGLVGLLVCGLLAATMSSMDSGLNRNVGFFIRNFYLSIVRPNAGEAELMVASKIATAVFGAIIIGFALMFASLKNLGLFDLMLLFGGLIALPVSIPMFWGVFVKKGPDWVCWTTIIIGLGISALCKFVLDATWLEGTLGLEIPLTSRESVDYALVLSISVNLLVCSIWFVGLSLWLGNRGQSSKRIGEINTFSNNLKTPLATEESESDIESERQTYSVMGKMCLIYGSFITALILIPNNMGGRMAFVFCGSVLLVVGSLLSRHGRKARLRPVGISKPFSATEQKQVATVVD